MEEKLKERNSYVDALRGIAMLLVVLGHTMTGSTENSQQSFLFQVIWSLQMPMFILISGYVTRYGSDISNFSEFIKFLSKRTVSYLWPWIVWTVVIRGMIFGSKSFLNLGYIFWHMDSGYWFLFTIWSISLIFGFSRLVSNNVNKNKSLVRALACTAMVYVLCMAGLALVGYIFGLSFLGIKLTLYYLPFYFGGFVYGKLQDTILKSKFGAEIIEIIIAISAVLWISIISNCNLYEITDDGLGIMIRVSASLSGCIAVCGLLRGVFSLHSKAWGGSSGAERLEIYTTLSGFKYNLNGFQARRDNFNRNNVREEISYSSLKWLIWTGKNSLEIYILHGLFLNLLHFDMEIDFETGTGIILVLLNYIITLLLTMCTVIIIQSNRFLNKGLFGK
jgi:fucose 4-O-acetylase-like acetyltransferase